MSTRIVISGEIDLEPEVREKALLDAQPLIAAALAESGCLQYAWTADLSRPGRVHVFEDWASETDLANHLVGNPYQGMVAHFGAVGVKQSVTRKYRIDHVEPVYDPEGGPRADFFTAR